jgi:Polysaccharide pyruvyl transferase
MQFGAFSYAYSTNVGDEIQTLSAVQFLPKVDILVDRDRLNRYSKNSEIFVIFNGWFNNPSWPPPDSISPLFVAFYANHPELLVNKKFADYFRRFEPIGCRSIETAEAFRRIGIDAYFSGCLTLTIQREPVPRTDQVYAVDMDEEVFARLVPEEVRRKAVRLSHEGVPSDFSMLAKATWSAADLGLRGMYKWDSESPFLQGAASKLNKHRHSSRIARALQLLTLYNSAKLVITSRLHCALPCLALGTPVILLRPGIESDARFAGLRELVRFHGDLSRPVSINWQNPEPNSDDYLRYSKALRETCERAVHRALKGNAPAAPLPAGTSLRD